MKKKERKLCAAMVLIACLLMGNACGEAEAPVKKYAESIPANHWYDPSAVITGEEGTGYMYRDWMDKLTDVPVPYLHTTTVRSVRDGKETKIEVNICISVDDRTVSDQIVGYRIYSNDRFLFSLPLYHEIPYANQVGVDRVFAALIDQMEDDQGLLICIPLYQDGEERAEEGYAITSAPHPSFFGDP